MLATQDPFSLEAKLFRWSLICLYLLGALVIASWIGTGQERLLAYLAFLTVGVLVMGALRQRAWILVLLAWPVAGYTGVLPLPLSGRDVAILMAWSASVTYRILIQKRAHEKLHWVEWILVLNLVYLACTLVINPVGFLIFGSSTIGARPYVSFTLATMSYWVIVRLPDSVKTVSRIPLLMLAGTMAVSLLYLIGYFFPSVPPHAQFLYALLDIGAYYSGSGAAQEIPRVPRIGELGVILAVVLPSYYVPSTLFNPKRWRCYAFLAAIACILASGFRNYLLWAVASLVIGSWLRRQWREFLLMCVAVALFLGLLTMGQGRFYELPMSAQRTLAFLPGQWDPLVKSDVEGSNVGRFQWWSDIIRYHMIEDWVFGDGFGASVSDLQLATSMGTFSEFIMLTGAYHNGPLSTIRYTGLIGLVLFYSLMIGTAVYAYRCVQQCRGTVLLPAAIFVAILAIWTPFHYTLVFGGFDSQVPESILFLAIARLLMRMSKEPGAKPVKAPSPSMVTERPQPTACPL